MIYMQFVNKPSNSPTKNKLIFEYPKTRHCKYTLNIMYIKHKLPWIETHENIIPQKLNNHTYYKVLWLYYNNKQKIPYNWPAGSQLNGEYTSLYTLFNQNTLLRVTQQCIQYYFEFKMAFSLASQQYNCLNNILLPTTRSCLSIVQASSSFKCLDTCTITYATPTYITEVLHLLTQVQLLLTHFTVN